jgi:hypothetical protein
VSAIRGAGPSSQSSGPSPPNRLFTEDTTLQRKRYVV